jgi:hypothetical protein
MPIDLGGVAASEKASSQYDEVQHKFIALHFLQDKTPSIYDKSRTNSKLK